jgi:hypothetical protein
MQSGPKIELAAERLGEDIEAWVTAHRADERTWHWIARQLAEKTGVQITAQWLGRLYGDRAESGAA